MTFSASLRWVAIALFTIAIIGRSQGVILNAGDTWNYSFTNLDYTGSQTFGPAAPFSYTATILSANYTFVTFQLFDGTTNVYTGGNLFAGYTTATGGINFLQTPWQSLSGSVTFSASDRISLDSLTIEVIRPGTIDAEPFGNIITSWDVFQATIVPTPEPTTLSFLTKSFVMFGFFRLLICKSKAKPGLSARKMNFH